MLKDFNEFVKEYKIVPLAIGFVMGVASNDLVKSLVQDVLMPIVAPLLMAGGTWQKAVLHLGPITIFYGSFLAQLLNFIILAFIIFIIVKKILKTEQNADKK
jgi:large conductance mechanosensitive channel